MITCELQREVGTHVTELKNIEAISVKPCMTGCYLVTLRVNGQAEEQLHVFADNPYHAVNRKIKDICESYGTTRGELGFSGVTYADDYDAGWTYKAGGIYRYTQPVVELTPEKPTLRVLEVRTRINTQGQTEYRIVWEVIEKDGSLREMFQPTWMSEDQQGHLIYNAVSADDAVRRFTREQQERFFVEDARVPKPAPVVEKPHTFDLGKQTVFVVHAINTTGSSYFNFEVVLTEYHANGRIFPTLTYPIFALNEGDAFDRFRYIFGRTGNGSGLIVDDRAAVEPTVFDLPKPEPHSVQVRVTVDGEDYFL